MKNFRSLVLLAILSLSAVQAHAVVISDLYNTGVDNSHVVLAGSAVDTHYELLPPIGSTANAIVYNTTLGSPAGWPIGDPWTGNTAISKWVGVDQLPGADRPYGLYKYTTTFVLPYNAILSTVDIDGQWAADDRGVDILINGQSTGIQTTINEFTFEPFSLNQYFQTGINYITFVISNDPLMNGSVLDGNGWSPTGLQVDMAGEYEIYQPEPVPEPSTIALVGLGIAGAALLRKRSRK